MGWGSDNDRDLLSHAMKLWDYTYRDGVDDAEAYRRLFEYESMTSNLDRSAIARGDAIAIKHMTQDVLAYQASARWADSGYQILEADESFASALMCSKAVGIAPSDLRFPWKAVRVVVPEGLLVDSESRPLTRMLVDGTNGARKSEGLRIWLHEPTTFAGALRAYSPPCEPAAALMSMLGEDRPGADAHARALRAACRYVVGLLVALQYTDNFKNRLIRARPKSSPWSRGEPAHRVTLVGAPLRVSFADAVRAYVAGTKRALPSVQSLVSGHYKRQVIGAAGLSRKVVWIEPYWRGPELAPILTRPRVVGSGRAS